MSIITKDLLAKAVGCVDATAGIWVPHLAATFDRYGLNPPARAAAFLAQVGHESMGLTKVEEGLNYSAEGLLKYFPKYFKTPEEAAAYARQPQRIANRVYANRMGNGDEASGDGWLNRGEGLIQVTGAENKAACRASLGLAPDASLSTPEAAAMSAGWFWDSRHLNALADAGDFEAITKRINGGLNGQDDRLTRWARAKAALGV